MRYTRAFLVTAAVLLLTSPATAVRSSPGRIIGTFSVSLDPSQSAAFQEVDGLSVAIEVLEYQEGGANDKTHKIVGPTRYSSIVLRRGATLIELLEERLLVASDPDEQQRLQDLIDRAGGTPHRIMYTSFDPRLAPDDDLFFNALVGDVFAEEGCEAFIVTAQIPILDPPVVELDPNDPKASRTVKKLFNPGKDGAGRLILTQRDGTPIIEWTVAEPMVVDVELLFDGSEQKENVKKDALKRTRKLAQLPFGVMDAPLIEFQWGTAMRFKGVLERLSVTYTRFVPDGTPVRCVMSVRLQESPPPAPPPAN